MKSQKKSVTTHKMIRESKRENPCAYIREYLTKNFTKITRSDAVRFFESKGIATHTARTQYQKFYALRNATKSKGAKGKGRKVAKRAVKRKVTATPATPATVTA